MEIRKANFIIMASLLAIDIFYLMFLQNISIFYKYGTIMGMFFVISFLYCAIATISFAIHKFSDSKSKANIACTSIYWATFLFFCMVIFTSGDYDEPQKNEITKNNIPVETKTEYQEPTKASESRLNETMHDLATQGKLTSDGLTKADIAYWALNSYGYDCEEVKSVKNVNYDKDRGFQYLFENDIDMNGFVKGYKTFVYKDVTCTSGTKLKLYKRVDNYPYIVEN